MRAQVLSAVQDVRRIDVDAGHGQAADDTRGAAARDRREARQDVQPGLQGVAQLAGVGGGEAGADAEVVELDVLVVPGDLADAGRGGERLGCVDRHDSPR